MDPAQSIKLDIDGPSRPEPETITALPVLELAAAYVDAIEKVAQAKSASLQVRGIAVVNKCVELQFGVTNPRLAQAAALDLGRYLQGVLPPSKKLKQPIARLRKAVQQQAEEGRTVRASIGDWSEALMVGETKIDLLPRVTMTIRATVNRVGGKQPGARFVSEEGDFTLDADETQTVGVAHHLYELVDLVAEIYRNEDGDITGGRLVEFRPVKPADAGAWLEWLDEAGRGWGTAEQVLKDLGRD
jgi:hypothetical protein